MKLFFLRAVSAFFARPIWLFMFGLALILALTGPFGTFERLSLWARLAYWTPIVLAANLFVRLSALVVDRLFAQGSPLQRQLLMIVVFPLVYAPAVWGFNGLFAEQFQDPPSLPTIWLQIFTVTVTVGLLTYFMLSGVAGPEMASPRLYQRLPEGTTASVVRMTVDDHYVEVHLDDGRCHRILMRFADAVSEMDGTAGFCTHRSHWVSAEHVREAFREKNREFLRLRGGATVPVSRTYRATVQAAGFLE